jgi:hypothetical protein
MQFTANGKLLWVGVTVMNQDLGYHGNIHSLARKQLHHFLLITVDLQCLSEHTEGPLHIQDSSHDKLSFCTQQHYIATIGSSEHLDLSIILTYFGL